jgi:hypothetical protein
LLLQGLEDDLPALLDMLKGMALGGDIQAMKLLLDRVLPVRKPSQEVVRVSQWAAASSLADKADAVLSAVADGGLSPEIGAQLVAALGTTARIVEVSELLARVEALEAAHG